MTGCLSQGFLSCRLAPGKAGPSRLSLGLSSWSFFSNHPFLQRGHVELKMNTCVWWRPTIILFLSLLSAQALHSMRVWDLVRLTQGHGTLMAEHGRHHWITYVPHFYFYFFYLFFFTYFYCVNPTETKISWEDQQIEHVVVSSHGHRWYMIVHDEMFFFYESTLRTDVAVENIPPWENSS